MIRNRIVLMSYFLLTMVLFAYGQEMKTIQGKIKDPKGNPIPGVSVIPEGAQTAVLTDSIGNYSVTIPSSTSTINYSKEGMQNASSSIGFSTNIDITMAEVGSEEYFDMSLEDLMNMEVTSVSKTAEKIQNVPSSIYLITARDIEKSSAISLDELLRESVPGYWAASLDYRNSDTYIRNTFAGSVLVLLDGTPMQDLITSTFSYNNFDIPLSEIDRIEVIKGSGGTVYGANSASGVISIFTKNGAAHQGVSVGVKAASPLYTNLNIGAGKQLSEKVSIRSYLQYNYFGGYTQMDAIENETSVVSNSFDGADTTINSRYTGDDRTTQHISVGLNPVFAVNEKLTISSNLHYNTSMTDAYNQHFPIEKSEMVYRPGFGLLPFAADTVTLENDNKMRFVGNIKADYTFSEANSLFIRASTNYENKRQILGGGYDTKNNIVDFEIQDNLNLPFNTLSIGANYRLVNYNLDNFYDTTMVNYVDPVNTETLTGAFVQDKISLFGDRLNIYLGVKAESFSLLGNDFYFSPMAKIVVNPIEKLTVWGGFTQSYTTPGYNQTNVQLNLFRMNSVDFFSTVVPLQVYQQTYETLIGMGLDEVTAQTQAALFMQSQAGQDTVSKYVGQGMQAYPGKYTLGATNGPNTEPTKMSNIEIGLRFQPFKKLYFETSFFKTYIDNGVINSLENTPHVASRVDEGEFIDAFFYGNYLKGSNTGLETVIRLFPLEGLEIELSHSWFIYDLEYKANDDFEIDSLSNSEKDIVDEKHPTVPENTIRAKVSYKLPKGFSVSVSGLYATAFNSKFGTLLSTWEYDLQRFDPFYGDAFLPAKSNNIFGENDSRTVINFKINKTFLNEKLDVYIFGNDITSSPFNESVNQLSTVYPRQVGGMYGMGLNYAF